MPAHSAKRVLRERLIPKLQRIIANIERNPIFTKEIKPGQTILSRVCAGTLRFRVKAVWVAGSFAQGARECGDLDLVVEVELLDKSLNNTAHIATCVRRGEKQVDVLVGTPDQNHTGMKFEGAVLLWTHEDRDWRSKIATIRVASGEVRMPRLTDRLPVSHHALRLSLEDAEELTQKLDTGHYEWQVVPYATIALRSEQWPEPLRRSTRTHGVGKESRVARDHAIEYVLSQPGTHAERLDGEGRRWRVGGSVIFCAPTAHFSLAELDRRYTCACIVVAPPKRAETGLWIVRRSPTHPLSAPLIGEKCWLEFSNGRPMHFTEFCAGRWQSMRLERARMEPPEFEDSADDEEEHWECRQVPLLDALSMSPGIVEIELQFGTLNFALDKRALHHLAACLVGAALDDSDWYARKNAIETALKIPDAAMLLAAMRMELEEDALRHGTFLAGGYYERHRP